MAAKVLQKAYVETTLGRVLLLAAAANAKAVLTGDDDDFGFDMGSLDPNSSNFLKAQSGFAKINFDFRRKNFMSYKSTSGVEIDFNDPSQPFAQFAAAAVLTRKIDVGGKLVSEATDKKAFRFALSREANNLLTRQVNVIARDLWDTFITRQYFGGEDVTPMSTLKNVFVSAIVADTVKIYEKEGPEGLISFSTAFLGGKVKIPQPPKQQTLSREELRKIMGR